MTVTTRKPLFLMSLIGLLLIVASQSSLAGRLPYTRDWREWSEIPSDSIQAEQLRIWVPNDSRQTVRMRIDILNRSNRVIRHFIEDDFGPGYINVYWDKKDDSGLWVRPGRYKSRIEYQGKERTAELMVSFDKSELLVQVYPESKKNPGKIRYEIEEDSVLVTAGTYLWGGKPISVPIKDSLYMKGSYWFEWTNPEETHQAAYRFHLKAAGVTHKTKITRVVNEKK